MGSGEAQNAKEGKFLKFGALHAVAFTGHIPELVEMYPNPADSTITFCHQFFYSNPTQFFSFLTLILKVADLHAQCGQKWSVCGDDSAAAGLFASDLLMFYARQLKAVEDGL